MTDDHGCLSADSRQTDVTPGPPTCGSGWNSLTGDAATKPATKRPRLTRPGFSISSELSLSAASFSATPPPSWAASPNSAEELEFV